MNSDALLAESEPTLEIIGDLMRAEDAGNDDALMSYLRSLEDRPLIRVVLCLLDLARGVNLVAAVEEQDVVRAAVVQNSLRPLASALTVSLWRFAEEPFIEAFKEHLDIVMPEG